MGQIVDELVARRGKRTSFCLEKLEILDTVSREVWAGNAVSAYLGREARAAAGLGSGARAREIAANGD